MKSISKTITIIIFYYIISTLINQKIYCIETRNLVMLLDVQQVETPNTELTTILNQLLLAIEQKVPFIVTPSLWNNFITRRKRFDESDSKKSLKLNPNDPLAQIYANNEYISFNCYATPFNPNEWIIKEIKSIAYILVPKLYLKNIENLSGQIAFPMKNNNETLFRCYGKNNSILPGNVTRRELLLGLKIDHCDNVADPFAPVTGIENQKNAMENLDWTELFVTRKDLGVAAPTPAGTKKILPPLKPAQAKERWEQMTEAEKEQRIELSPADKKIIEEYAQYQKDLLVAYKKAAKDPNAAPDVFEQYMWSWIIFLNGHGMHKGDKGGEEEVLASLSVKNFLQLTLFLNYSVKTFFFFYDTCYGAGQHADPTFQYAYEHTKKIVTLPFNLNYIIVSGALTDESTLGFSIVYRIPEQKTPAHKIITIEGVPLTLYNSYVPDFNAFFIELKKLFTQTQDKKTIPDIIKIIHRFGAGYDYSNIPIIRFPNTEWFTVTDLNEKIDILDRNTITKYLQEKQSTLTVQSLSILLYEPYLPMPIAIQDGYTRIVPMNTERDAYFFEKIILSFEPNPFNYFKTIFQPFTPHMAIITQKFYIKMLEANFTIANNNTPGEMGNSKYKNTKITLFDVIISQTGNSATAKFKFNADNGPIYFVNSTRQSFDNYKVSLEEPESPQALAYKEEFTEKEKDFKMEFKKFQHGTQTIDESLKQIIENKNIRKAPELGPIISERKLIRTLNELTQSLNTLTKSLK